MATSGKLITRKYNNFKGIDTREGEISLNRSPDALNMYKNYKSSNMLETRPDIELLTAFDSPIYGLFFYEVGSTKQLIVHSGTKLYKVENENVLKSSDLNEVNIVSGDIEFNSSVSNHTYSWRWANDGQAEIFYAVFQTINGKKCMYFVKYQYVSSDKDYLIGYWENTTGNKYKYVEDTSQIPEAVMQPSSRRMLLDYYGDSYIKFGHTLTQQNTSASALPVLVGSKPIMTQYIKTILYSSMIAAKSHFFVYSNILYIKDSTNYLAYNGSTCSAVVGYIPTTSISRTPAGGGTIYEDVNLLSNYRKNGFCGDDSSTEYFLDEKNITDVTSVVVNGTTYTKVLSSPGATEYTVDTTNGKVTFGEAPSKPDTDGQDNVLITYEKVVSGYANRILQCRILAVFDNRVFFSGNPNFPNVVWHSSLDDPTYVSDLDYYNEGLDLAKVKALVPGNNALWVFKEPSQANTTVFYHVPTIDASYGKIYPSSHSSISTGCVATGRNFNDDICFFSDRGLEGISGDITSEQVVAHRSSFIDSKLLSETNYSNMILEEWEGYLLVFIGKHVYLADSRSVTALNGAYEYDWFYWELSKEVVSTMVKNGVLYIGTTDGLYTLTKEGNVENYWITPKDVFGYGNYQKITNKRGCVIECEGEEIDVSVSTNKDTLSLIKNFINITDYIVARIKRKKFKDIQLKISSNKPMKLESIMLECYIGAYIKR